MRFTSRNYLLYLLAVGALIVGIVSTAVSNQNNQMASAIEALNNSATSSDVAYHAEVVATNWPPDRKTNLATMREKVREVESTKKIDEPLELSAENEEVPKMSSDTETVSAAQLPLETELKKCPWYKVYDETWPKGQVAFSVREGARVLATVAPIIDVSTTSTSTTIADNIIIQLPLITVPPKVPTCLPSDVVAIALDGSLIRNNEKNLYGIFPSPTLLGYALDGFPLYGTNNQSALDKCGGVMVDGQYRYYLQSERENILNCFAGSPIKI